MATQKFYEGQEFHNPSDPSAPVLVYRGGKFLPKDAAGNVIGGAAPKLAPQDLKALSDLRAQAEKSVGTATQAERFLQLNKTTPTGGAARLPFVGGLVQAYRSATDPDYAQMEGITSAVAPGLRPPGSGSSSDKDVQFYKQGFTNVEAPYAANLATYDRLHQQSDRDAAHAAFMDKWSQVRGSLAGGEEAFLKYWAGRPQAKTQSPRDMLKARSAAAQAPVESGQTVDIFGRPVQ